MSRSVPFSRSEDEAGEDEVPEEFKRILEPYAWLWYHITQLGQLTDEEVHALNWACDEPTGTNCWYATYHVAQLLRPFVDEELARREKRKTGDPREVEKGPHPRKRDGRAMR